MNYLELMKIKGIPLRVHSSWILVLFLFTWSSQAELSYLFEAKVSVFMCWWFGFLSSLLVFGSVLLHELGHSFIALREGVKIKSITLFLHGGIAIKEKECETALSSLRVAVAGPLVSVFLTLFFFGSFQFLLSPGSMLSTVFSQLGRINLLLSVFNLLPVLPLDGGLILKSLVWHFTGNQRKGLRVANSSGKWISIFVLFLGSFFCLTIGGFYGIWLIFIGWFGFSFSRSQNQIFTFQDILSKLKVEEVSSRGFRILEADNTLVSLSKINSKSSEKNFSSEWILICKSGRWLGYVKQNILNEVPANCWDNYSISEYCSPLSDLPSINGRQLLWEAVLKLETSSQERLLVLNLAGLPSGTIDRVDIGKEILHKIGIKLPKSFFDISRKQRNYPLGMSLYKLVQGMISSGLVSQSKENK